MPELAIIFVFTFPLARENLKIKCQESNLTALPPYTLARLIPFGFEQQKLNTQPGGKMEVYYRHIPRQQRQTAYF